LKNLVVVQQDVCSTSFSKKKGIQQSPFFIDLLQLTLSTNS
jgi:hypothetical protein